MNDIITVCGIVATEPRHLVTDTGIAITSMRLASPSRRWDRASSSWVNGDTNWYTVTAFRSLAANVHKSVKKGDRVVVCGRVRIRPWERDGRGGTSVEVDADAVGHDLAWGISNWIKVPRHVGDPSTVPGTPTRVDPRTGEVDPGAGEVDLRGDDLGDDVHLHDPASPPGPDVLRAPHDEDAHDEDAHDGASDQPSADHRASGPQAAAAGADGEQR